MTETPDAVIVSDSYRPVVIAQRRHGGGVVISRGARYIALGPDELDRLVKFAHDGANFCKPGWCH
jgi:hypothetical protein